MENVRARIEKHLRRRLEPCPCCGGEARFEGGRAHCAECPALGPFGRGSSPVEVFSDAAARWNARSRMQRERKQTTLHSAA